MQEGASTKDAILSSLATSALSANAEWMRSIQQLVEVRATMVRL